MAKKAVVSKTPFAPAPVDTSKNLLVKAVVTVRNLQDFIKDRGGLEAALGTVTRVGDLVASTGGFEELKAALEIVGREDTPPNG